MTRSRFREIADEMRERIALGDVGDSGALESEAALGRCYGASRVTVRRALETLRDEGLVQSRQGSGWFVTGASFQQRLALGTFRPASSAVAEAGTSPRRTVVSFAYETAPPPVALGLRLPEDAEVLHSRSVRTVDAVPLDVVQEWVPAGLAGRLSRADAAEPGIWASLRREGRRVATVRQTITAEVAGAEDAERLGVPVGAPLLLVRRLALDAEDTPLALSDHRYLAHRFSLEVEFHGWPVTGPDAPPGLRDNAAPPPVMPPPVMPPPVMPPPVIPPPVMPPPVIPNEQETST